MSEWTVDDSLAPFFVDETGEWCSKETRTPIASTEPLGRTHGGASPPDDRTPLSEGAAGSERFRPGEVLARGGMALVRVADQVALGRTVAVKELFETDREERDIQGLVQEARVNALLEHPNIVPVHDLDYDRSGVPFIVMKRVSGVSWHEVMEDEVALRERGETRSLLEWNLAVLIAVCDAVRFAHSHGIVHRDLKPSNVMIGDFGEVYLVDWGIAVHVGEVTDPTLPRQGTRSWVGTIPYMAPEMILAGEPLTTRTDVYQLGGMLFQVLTSRRPHPARPLDRAAQSILSSPPDVDPGTDPVLASIVSRAMAQHPDDRFPTVDAFQRALREYERHRASMRLVDAAENHSRRLEAAVDAGDPDTARRAFDEARSVLLASLDEWAGNERATRVLRDTAATMAEFELSQGRPDRAEDALNGVHASLALLEECRAARTRQQADLARGRDADPARGLTVRVVVFSLVGVAACSLPLIHWLWGAGPTAASLQITDAISLATGFAFLLSRRVREIPLHSRLVAIVVCVCLARLALTSGQGALGLNANAVYSLSFLLWAMMSAGVAVLLNPRVFVTVPVYLAGFGASLVWPESAYLATSVGHFALFVTIAWLQTRQLRAGADPNRRVG